MEDNSVDKRLQVFFDSTVALAISWIPSPWIPVILSLYATFVDLFERGKTQLYRTGRFVKDSFADETLYFPDPSVGHYPFIYRTGSQNLFGTPSPLWTYSKTTAVLKNVTLDLPCKETLPFLDATLFEEDHEGTLRVVGSFGNWPEKVRTNRRTEIPWNVLLFSWANSEDLEIPLYEKVYRLHLIQEDASDLWIRFDHGKDTVLADLEKEDDSQNVSEVEAEMPSAPCNSEVSEVEVDIQESDRPKEE